MSDACLFCDIVAGKIPSTPVLDAETVYAFRDIAPAAPVHVLVVPKEHLTDISTVTRKNGQVLADLMVAATEVARLTGVDRSGFRLVFNVGPDAGQTVFHLHGHLVGGRSLGGVAH